MGLLKDLKDRNKVYDQLIIHFKDKVAAENKNNDKNQWIMDTYDCEVKKADEGSAYLFEKLLAHCFGGLSIGLGVGSIVTDQPAFLVAALASAGVSIYNYIKFKNLSLGRALGTRMFYAETLQNILEENGFPYSFRSGELEDYKQVEDYVELITAKEKDMID